MTHHKWHVCTAFSEAARAAASSSSVVVVPLSTSQSSLPDDIHISTTGRHLLDAIASLYAVIQACTSQPAGKSHKSLIIIIIIISLWLTAPHTVLTTASIRRVYTDYPSAPTICTEQTGGHLSDIRAGSAIGTTAGSGGGGLLKVKPRT